jgi:hypothetical protein
MEIMDEHLELQAHATGLPACQKLSPSHATLDDSMCSAIRKYNSDGGCCTISVSIW